MNQSVFKFDVNPDAKPQSVPLSPQKRWDSLETELEGFSEFGVSTRSFPVSVPEHGGCVRAYVNEFWTAKQRAASSLHEVSYRACFKPQLPRFFIERLTAPGDVVYDPFMGRGTTPLEAALADRIPYGCDINPLSKMLLRPRLAIPSLSEIYARLGSICLAKARDCPGELLVFYHPDTLREIAALREHLIDRERSGAMDAADEWIRMVAINRLTGHSPGFFSVYTLPPNQATSVQAQIKINAARNQSPPRRSISPLILRKSRHLLSDADPALQSRMAALAPRALLLTAPASQTPDIPSESVQLVVTSPPFLNVVNYAGDNWLRCWFAGIDPKTVRLTVPGKLEKWKEAMTAVFHELKRVLKPGGHVAFEVGEVRKGTIRLEEAVLPCGMEAGLHPRLILINDQKFTKTANCWGVGNNTGGTNTNRIVLFQKRREA